MIRNAFRLIVLFLYPLITFAQTNDYNLLVEKADSAYSRRSYLQAAQFYSAAFEKLGWKGYLDDRYKAAKAWSLANVPDSAFENLFRIAQKDFDKYDQLRSDTNLKNLHADKRWTEIVNMVLSNKIKSNGNNPSLKQTVDSMAREDQRWRNMRTQKLNGAIQDKITEEDIVRKMISTDSLNYFLLDKIFNQHGFLGIKEVGKEGSKNFWLLVQHQDQHPDFQERVLVKMKMEVDSGNANPGDYAYLVDRVCVNTGKPQVYGTQMQLNSSGTSYEPKKVLDPPNLNKRRASVGLGTIEEYIEVMNDHYRGSLSK